MTRRSLVVFFGFVMLVLVPETRTEECLVGSTNGNCSSTSSKGFNPCSDVICPESEVCKLEVINCLTEPCPQPIPRCVPESISCDPCSGIICPEGEVCEFEVINCFTTPCPQPKPRCVGKPVNPCATVLCKPPQVCKVETLPCLIPPCPTRAVCESKICESGEPLIVEYTGKLISCGDESGITCPEPYKCQKSLSDDRQVCCPPKETRCPLRRCIRNCDYYKFDENGCRTCQCIQDPCNDLQCDKEQKCVLQAVHCIRPPCPPAPVCIPDCPLLKCDKNCQYYKYDENRCRTCECDTDDPCLTHKCKPNERCVIKEGYCFKSPCKPLPRLPTCLPECPLYKCADQNCTHYKYDKNGCRTCGCDDRCLTHKCELGQRCELQEVQCIRAPCPPILTCVPCPQVRCANACKYYKYDSNGCQTCQCDDPCLNHKCDLGQRCELENVQCIRAPCPPIPKCVSCLQKNCSNFCKFYKYDSNECQTCECDDRCLTHKCEPGQRCELQEVVCVRAPCLPVPQCIDDPCSTKKCNPGERCEIEELKCIKAPCPVIAKCVAGCPEVLCTRFCNTYKHDAKGCRICECEDTCLSKKCKPGERCILDKVFCKKPPCPPRPICIPECPLVDCLNYCESYKRDEKGCQTCEYIGQTRHNQDLTAHTSKPPERPQSMSMLAEDSDTFHPTPIPTTSSSKDENSTKISATTGKNVTNNSSLTEEPKGRALNFTMGKNDGSNILLNTSTNGDSDLSDVSINDNDDFDMDMVNPKILAPKTELKNVSHVGVCEQGGLTYENGDKIENDCDSVCTCINGTMNCTERCSDYMLKKGARIDDPLCYAEPTEDMCCSLMVCATDTGTEKIETEPLEYCSYNNKTYNRGDVHKEGCTEVCTCEAGGNMSCKPRCPPVTKPNDRCVEVPNPGDACCKKVLCDVTLEDNESDKEDEKIRKILSAKYVNSTTISLKLDPKIELTESSLVVEISDDKVNWKKYKVLSGGYVTIKMNARYIKLENTDDITNIQNFEGNPKDIIKEKPSSGCQYKDKLFKIGEEYNDDCTSLCICQQGGMKCLKIQCPTYFGVDILDPNCVEWETIPPNFDPSPPNCCPTSVRCKNNGSCQYEGAMYKNWEQLPVNVTGCERRCYCEMGKVECQNTCPPVTAHPPPNLPCPPSMARLDHIPEDDCCKYWICNTNENDPATDNNVADIKNITKTPYQGSLASKTPSKTMGPLAVYENEPSEKISHGQKPKISPQENPFYHKSNSTKTSNNIPNKYDKSKNKKPSVFVTPAPNPTIETSTAAKDNSHIHSEIEIHGNGNPEELLQFINQHPELSNYPSGSVLEIHNLPTTSKTAPNSISNSDKSQIHLVPYLIPQNEDGENIRGNLPPGFSLEQILHEFHKNTVPNGQVPYASNPNFNRPFLGQHNIPLPTRSNATHPGISAMFPGPFPGFHQPDDDILVHTLEAIDPHTVRLAFMVPPVIVNLHGRVEVRYTDKYDDDNMDSWKLQVFAPPNDLIATPSLEFDLQNLLPNTEYKIKITITLRDIHTTHSSKIYKIKTPRALITTTLPPMIPIEPELAITDINSTWVTVVWKKFDENELRFIDGVQIRYREIDGKLYAATPLIHRAVTSYTLEKLKPNTKYEIGIFFIPFPGQLTELHAEHMLHFTTANEVDTYGFNVTLEVSQIKSQNVEISWNGVPYPEDKYVNIYRAIYQSDSGKEDQSMFKIAKRDSPTKTIITELKPGTRYRLWLEVYLTNGKIKTSNVQDFITKPRSAPVLGASTQQDKLARAEHLESKGDYYGPLVIVAILAAIAVLSTLVLLLILIRRHNQNKAAITPPSRVSQSAYDNPTYKVEIQQETMGL